MPWCTGTLISDRLLLTAGHCFDPRVNGVQTPARVVGTSVVDLPPTEIAPLMEVFFNYQRDAKACQNPAEPRTCQIRRADAYPIERLVEHRRGLSAARPSGLDHAMMELGPGKDQLLPGMKYSAAVFDPASTTLARAFLLTIIQHPAGEPQRI